MATVDSMKQYKREGLIPSLIILGLVLAIMGSRGAWINLPISGSFPGTMDELLSLRKVIEIFRRAFLVTILLAGVCGLLRYRLISLQLTFVSLLIILGFVVYSLFYEYRWIVSYIEQSEERLALQSFITRSSWPNINPDHTVVLTGTYEFLWERLLLSWNIIGVGLKVVFMGVIILLLSGAMQEPVPRRFNVITGAVLFAGMLAVFVPLIRADYIHHQGDALLGAGEYKQALQAYDTAFRLDPMLAYSAPFLIKVSRLYYHLEGEHSVSAGLYMLHTVARNVIDMRFSPAFRETLNQTRLMIDNISLMEYEPTELRNAVIRQMNKEDTRLWVLQGRVEYNRGKYEASLNSFRHALQRGGINVHAQFFIANALAKLERNEDALAVLKPALGLVWTKQLRADFQCTIGDIYEKLARPLLAREAYTSCYDLDSVYNYRAVLRLGGT